MATREALLDAPDRDAYLARHSGLPGPRANLEQSYGAEFAAALAAAPLGKWQALSSREGLRVMRLAAITPPEPAHFESLRGVVLQDWTDATLAEQRSQAVRALAKKYTVKTTVASQ